MIICQTLWTQNKDLMKESFGWLTPQHHLMGWALSVTKLVQHYNAVNLYTDSNGKKVLIDGLGLPYVKTIIDYDDFNYPSYLWALPKLLTYAKQRQPFLHVDGDIMLWQPFEESLLSGELIAQNLERGTEYYQNCFWPLLNELIYVPQILKENLVSHKMMAYNAGIIGGRDLSFFKRFVSLAVKFIDKNRNCKLDGNFNMIAEQLLFFSIAKKENKNVKCYFDKVFDDNKYYQEEMADFYNIKKLKYLHLIGSFKRQTEVCDMLARHLRQESEELYLRIINLFKEKHYFYNSKLKNIFPGITQLGRKNFKYTRSEQFAKSLDPNCNFGSNLLLIQYIKGSRNLLLKALFSYEQKINRICAKFSKIDVLALDQLENSMLASVSFLDVDNEERKTMVIRRNPYVEIIYSAFDWTTIQILRNGGMNVRCSWKDDFVIAIIPELFFPDIEKLFWIKHV